MDKKYRAYLRELNKKEIKSLDSEYKEFVKPRNSGFLTTKDKELFLHERKWEEETTEQNVYDFFSNIREKTESAMKDFELLCDVLTEKQLEIIFGKTKDRTYNLRAKDMAPLEVIAVIAAVVRGQ